MKAKEAWVIVPFSRPQYLDNVIANFTRQTFQNKKLIIIENGKAIGTCKERNFEPDVLLTSGPHQSLAKNEGIDYIRKHGGGWFFTNDDDDFYHGGYVEEQVSASDKAEIVGKADFFVKMANGNLRLFTGIGSNEYVNFIHGPTICTWTELDCEFPMVEKIGEDCQMVERLIGQGARVWATSKYNFMYTRSSDPNHNTWEISDASLTASLAMGIGPRGFATIKDFGPNFDMGIIDGTIPEPEDYTVLDVLPGIQAEIDRYNTDGAFEKFMKKELIEMGMISEGENPDNKLERKAIQLKIWNSFKDGMIEEVTEL